MRASSGELDDRFSVSRINSTLGKNFIREHHYSHGCHNGPMTWGLFDKEALTLIGVIAFATPCSENVRRCVFGPGREHNVTELHRLVILDGTPSNTESWFIVRALRLLKERKPDIQAVLSFADSSEGHYGTIYQATNALFTGSTGRSRFYLDPDGRLRHPRQNGHNVTPQEAAAKGWTSTMRDSKFRYLYLLGSPSERRRLRKEIILAPRPYPRKGN